MKARLLCRSGDSRVCWIRVVGVEVKCQEGLANNHGSSVSPFRRSCIPAPAAKVCTQQPNPVEDVDNGSEDVEDGVGTSLAVIGMVQNVSE